MSLQFPLQNTPAKCTLCTVADGNLRFLFLERQASALRACLSGGETYSCEWRSPRKQSECHCHHQQS